MYVLFVTSQSVFTKFWGTLW